MKQNLTAIFRVEKMGDLKSIYTCAYSTKKEFKQELKDNGFVVLGIYTDKQIEEIKANKNAIKIQEEYIKQVL